MPKANEREMRLPGYFAHTSCVVAIDGSEDFYRKTVNYDWFQQKILKGKWKRNAITLIIK